MGVATFDNYASGIYDSADGQNFPCRDNQVTGERTFVSSFDAQVYSFTADDSKAQQTIEKLQNGPLTIVVDGYGDDFRFYGGGIISEADCVPTQLSHQIVLVGY